MGQVQFETQSSQYATAFKSVRSAKNLFLLLVLLAILIQLGGFILVHFVGLTEAPAVAEKQAEASGRAEFWQNICLWAFPTSGFMALVAGVLLALTLLLAVKLSLLGRLGGVAGFISAFFWSLILLALLAPWQHLLRGAAGQGSLYGYFELEKLRSAWAGADAPWASKTLYYIRFLAYPAVTILVWAMVQWKFAGGYKQTNLAALQDGAVAEESGPAEPTV